MDERSLKKILVPSCVIVLLSTTLIYELKYLIDFLFFKKKHILVIGILSAPENFQQRLSIRKTWLQLLTEISGSAYFIIGNEVCEVPPYDRADPYSCVDKPFLLPLSATKETEFMTMRIVNPTMKSTIPGFIGFGFYVRSRILVKKLGIYRELLKMFHTEVQVKLVSAFDNKILASVTFNSDLVSESSSEVVTKAINPVELRENFEGYVKLEARNIAHVLFPKCDWIEWEYEPNVINFIQLWQENSVIPQPFTEKSCTFVSMIYTVLDIDHIQKESNNRTFRFKDWHRLNKKLSYKLDNESKTFNDIIFVDVIDVYRNLSMKMTEFYKRIVRKEYFHYILKADDDSFVDILRVHSQLREVNREIDEEINKSVGDVKETGVVARLRLSKFWWWSFFKEYWRVERSGKWREDQYRSASYPTFPCGGGYVLNKGIVDYVAGNNQHLYHFQGEDVSLGIWLSTLPVIQYKIPRVIHEDISYYIQKKIITKYRGKRAWVYFKMNKTISGLAPNYCEWTCSNKKYSNIPLCNKVQLSVKSMYTTWRDYIKRGFL